MRVVATAGHVDHGKSSLVLAVTGTDPDRFAEEKARGLTIDLGFAFTTLPSGATVGFVDVPGHVRFVKNMLAGVGAVDVAVLVVAADDGWMPQTAEHVEILELLGIDHGVVALTKCALVDDDVVLLTQLDLVDRLAGSRVSTWPIIAIDSVSGDGLGAFVAALDDVLASAPPPRDDARPRLWVDRVFSARGSGTVVTGTLVGGALARDDDVVVEPGRRPARVRRIESAHAGVDVIGPGNRVALNLAGIDHASVHRGDAVVRPGQWLTPTTVDVEICAMTRRRDPVRGAVQVYVGSGEHAASVRPITEDGRFARIELPAGVPLAPGDRMVLRSSARRETIGGAEVVDVEPARTRADARRRMTQPIGARLMEAHTWATPAELAPAAGAGDAEHLSQHIVAGGHAIRVAGWLVAPGELDRVRDATNAAVEDEPAGTQLAPLASALGITVAQLRAALKRNTGVVVDRDAVYPADRASPLDSDAARALLLALDSAPFTPPAPDTVGAPPALVRLLVQSGAVVDVGGIVFSRDAYDTARRRIVDALMAHGAVTVADVRALLGSSRKYVVPLLTRLDAEGVTRRRGDERIAGPRA